MESKWLGDSFLLVCHIDQVEKGAERGEPRYKEAPIRESETPLRNPSQNNSDDSAKNFQPTKAYLPGHSHVGRCEVGGGLVHPLAHLPQYVPLPVVCRPLHLETTNHFWKSLPWYNCYLEHTALLIPSLPCSTVNL